ncbi:MAG TPA: hypothetical protein VLF39_01845 [Candidatus Saccharimonadales bacterium]|nr:hypothetical protein [Candidatus Saccharimonadales bacterium]
MLNNKAKNPIDDMSQYSSGQALPTSPDSSQPSIAYSQMGKSRSPKKFIIVAAVLLLILAAGVVWALASGNKNNTSSNSTGNQNPAASNTPTSQKDPTAAGRDSERVTDIKSIDTLLELFYQNNTYYPALADLNDPTWISNSMPGLQKELTRDPSGSGYDFAETSVKGQYGYRPLNSSGQDCDNGDTNACVTFTLTYTLENGTQKSVKSNPTSAPADSTSTR